MALSPGARLGPYEIVAQIGVGGMGEVYRATDTNLKRQVAIKVLPEALAADPDRLARFQREAEVLAALNHPHIAHIHGVERSTGTIALVMELVEGPTLADRIAEGAIPLEEALPIATQIAEALESAHEHGIIHRDLKPANIKLRPDGAVKVLDFGLAKALAAEGSTAMSHSVSMSPTLTTPAMTNVGVIMGTAAYMAPEQAKGRPVDKRTDVWAFGCVLYEMLAGVRAFDGDDMAEALASVIKTEPDWTKLPSGTPRSVQRLLRQCLRKDPKQRIPAISVARYELDEVMAGTSPQDATVSGPPSAHRTSRARMLAFVGTTAIVALGLGAAATWAWLRPAPSPLTQVRIQRPDGTPMGSLGNSPDLDISPDGRKVVYVVGGGTTGQQMYMQALEEREPQSFPNIGNPVGPVLSPDGRWIAFFDSTTSTIRKIPASGGSPVTIASFDGASRGMSWGGKDIIVFSTLGGPTGLMRVPAAGGTPEVLTTPDVSKGEYDHWLPHQLPGERGILFTIVASAVPAAEAMQTAVFDSRTGEYRTILAGASSARYVPTGHIVYAGGGTLRAVRFNLERLEVLGEGVPVVEQVATKLGGAVVSAAVSSNGTLAYLHGVAAGAQRSLAWIGREGREEPILAPVRAYAYPRLSPDGTRVALDIRDQESDTWIWDLNRRNLTRVTFDPGMNRGVAWSPNGTRIAFSAQRDGGENLYWQSPDGTGVPEKLTEGKRPQLPHSFTPDGKFLLFVEPDAQPFDIYMLNLDDRKVQPLLASPKFSENGAQVSPNGRWLAYESNESGGLEVFVRPFPDVQSGRWQVSIGGGTRPLWSPTGKELFYLTDPSTIMAVPVDIAAPAFSYDTPVAIVKADFISPNAGLSYTVSRDGKRFIVIKDATRGSSTPQQLVLIFNWLDELKRLLP